MHTDLEKMRGRFSKLAAFYKERAEGGVGPIVTGGIAPNFAGPVSSITPLARPFLGDPQFLSAELAAII